MIKKEELANPNSCMSKASDNEMTFVLLGRDVAMPVAIRAWIEERIRLGKNTRDDAQIVEAEQVIKTLEQKCKCVRCMQAINDNDGLNRFIVCAKCGNKRCPHSDWHGNECTRSNEPGQPGSRYEVVL